MSAMMAKLRARIAYDVIFPSAEYVQRLRSGFLPRRIDRDKIRNIDTVYSYFDDPWFDPDAEHSTPYGLYATGLGYRADKVTGMTGSCGLTARARQAGEGLRKTALPEVLHGPVLPVPVRPDRARRPVLLQLEPLPSGLPGVRHALVQDLLRVGVAAMRCSST